MSQNIQREDSPGSPSLFEDDDHIYEVSTQYDNVEEFPLVVDLVGNDSEATSFGGQFAPVIDILEDTLEDEVGSSVPESILGNSSSYVSSVGDNTTATINEIQVSNLQSRVGENQPGTSRKRTADAREETSARKVSRVIEDDQVPTSSRSAQFEDKAELTEKPVDIKSNPTGAKANAESDSDENEDNTNCSICMEPYTNSGSHRICCLKCGHIFGQSCIERWLAGQKSCPLCNAKAIRHDLRLLFTKNLVALDSAQLERTKNELERVKISKEKLNYELHRVKLALELKEKELQALKSRGSLNSDNPTYAETGMEETVLDGENSIKTKFIANVALEKDAQFRVGAYCEQTGLLVVSQALKNPLYPNGAFGIRTVKMYDAKFSFTKSVLHQKQIRDLCFAKYTDYTVLTCGMDKKAILSNIEQKVVIHTFNVSEPLWSCAWDAVNPNLFYVGTGNGRIMSYDVRSPKEVHSVLDSPLANSPVARMVFTDREEDYTGNGRRHNGILIQHLNSVWYGQMNNNTCEEYERIPVEGAFTNMDFDPKTQLMLLTTRSVKCAKETVNIQNVYQLNRRTVSTDNLITLEAIRTAELPRKNQVLMTRSKIWSPYEDSKIPAAVATDWSEREEGLWFPTSNNMSLYAKHYGDVVVDFVPVNRGGKSFVISITADKIRLIGMEKVKSKQSRL